MKKLFTTSLLIILGSTIFAQENIDSTYRIPRNNLSFNLIGDVSLLSLNYERLFIVNSSIFFTSKLGVGSTADLDPFSTYLNPTSKYYHTYPHHLTMNTGIRRYFFEFGLGGTYIIGRSTRNYLYYPILGFRYISKKNVHIRLFGYLPRPKIQKDFLMLPFGLNIGQSF